MPELVYRSGDQIVLEYVGQRFAFSRRDFAERVAVASRSLALLPGEAGRLERADLCELATRGAIDVPRSGLGHALAASGGQLVADVAYWLRKLVFRRAWIDVRVAAGLLTAEFDGLQGSFHHRHDGYDVPPASLDDVPRFELVLRGDEHPS